MSGLYGEGYDALAVLSHCSLHDSHLTLGAFWLFLPFSTLSCTGCSKGGAAGALTGDLPKGHLGEGKRRILFLLKTLTCAHMSQWCLSLPPLTLPGSCPFLVLPVSAGVGILSACLGGCLGPLLGVRCWGGAGFGSSDTCPLFDSQQSPSAAGGRTSLRRRGCCSPSHSPQTRPVLAPADLGGTRGAGGEGTGVVGHDRVDEALREIGGVFHSFLSQMVASSVKFANFQLKHGLEQESPFSTCPLQ